ncbi:hypothetical protein DN752_04180 [Echinicola strongylocentroti]|uniref:Uncharacterized protein n=1 Tax=Echinicola strongylocentroti TaxID=1795355 RepID=A0A2Z4IEW6_9BACT|nr:hypothetical protein [Echinicola strongylocentroti]AWW29405.1 hypothetical protein DN752_04180 [Echinicola strongylocentroti]
MEAAIITTLILLILFALLATYDGLYLHLVKYRLYEHADSRFEHITHTVRAILFPLTLIFFYLSRGDLFFYIGLVLILLDILALGIDAYSEKESRNFMGGLPQREYILHLFVNGFHFAAISVFLVLKLKINENGIEIVHNADNISNYPTFVWFVQNLIPGAVMMGLLHTALIFKAIKKRWNAVLNKFSDN